MEFTDKIALVIFFGALVVILIWALKGELNDSSLAAAKWEALKEARREDKDLLRIYWRTDGTNCIAWWSTSDADEHRYVISIKITLNPPLKRQLPKLRRYSKTYTYRMFEDGILIPKCSTSKDHTIVHGHPLHFWGSDERYLEGAEIVVWTHLGTKLIAEHVEQRDSVKLGTKLSADG